MELGQLLRNNQTKSSTTVLSRATAVNLTETFEEVLRLFISEPAPCIDDLEPDVHLVAS